MSQNEHPETSAGLSNRLIFLFAVTAGASVGNLYWSQPLLAYMAQSFGVATHDAGMVVTLTQVGYALGVFSLVPLGDMLPRQKLIPAVLILSAAALVASAVAPNLPLLLAASLFLGFATVAGQIVTPLTGDLASDAQRGKALGLVVSGLVFGILVIRAVSGILADFLGWRTVFVIGAVIMVVLALLMGKALPVLPPKLKLSYGGLLKSMLQLPFTDKRIPRTLLLGALPMGTFMLFWTGMTLLLSGEPFHYSAGQIGTIGLLSITGAAASLGVGRLHDKGLSRPATLVGIFLMLIPLALSAIWYQSVWPVALVIIVFSAGIQVLLVLIQTRMLSLNPMARSRLNTLFVVSNFIAGSLGSAIAALSWNWDGWQGLAIIGSGLMVATLIAWVVDARATDRGH